MHSDVYQQPHCQPPPTLKTYPHQPDPRFRPQLGQHPHLNSYPYFNVNPQLHPLPNFPRSQLQMVHPFGQPNIDSTPQFPLHRPQKRARTGGNHHSIPLQLHRHDHSDKISGIGDRRIPMTQELGAKGSSNNTSTVSQSNSSFAEHDCTLLVWMNRTDLFLSRPKLCCSVGYPRRMFHVPLCA